MDWLLNSLAHAAAMRWEMRWGPRKLIEAARKQDEKKEEAECHQPDSGGKKSRQGRVADAFFMEGSMLWKEMQHAR
jgi:hypothetical protein